MEHATLTGFLVEHGLVFFVFCTKPRGTWVEHTLGRLMLQKNPTETITFCSVWQQGVPPAFCVTFVKHGNLMLGHCCVHICRHGLMMPSSCRTKVLLLLLLLVLVAAGVAAAAA